MIDNNSPTIASSLLPANLDLPDNESSIHFIGQLFSGPVMQSLVRLNPNARSDRLYHSWINPLAEVGKVDSKEKWDRKMKNFLRRAPNGIISFGTDCSEVEKVLENLDQLRLLWDNQLITTEAFRVIFAEMSQHGKTSYTELNFEDGERLDYNELQMQFMIRSGIAVQGFTDEINAKLRALLH